MGPLNIRRAQRHEMFVPKGSVTVSDVYPRMKQFDLHTLLRLRTDGSLARVGIHALDIAAALIFTIVSHQMIQLQSEDAEAAALLVQQAQTPNRVHGVLTSSSESPEIIGVSASYDDEMPPRIGDDIALSNSADMSPKRTPEHHMHGGLSRRRSVKDMVEQMRSSDPVLRAAASKELESRGAIGLHGMSGDKQQPELTDPPSAGLRVQSGAYISEVVGRLSEKQEEKQFSDDDSRADSMDSLENSTLDDDAKLYQERLNNRTNNVLVKRDAASFRVKKDSAKGFSADRPAVSRVAAARLHTKKNQHKITDAAVNATYTFEQLKNRTVEELAANPYPPDVDIENREQYLKDDDFFQVFGLTKTDFNGIAKWRKTEMKKKKNLY